ncbi:hypothetical protein ALTERO38_60376 [Alteromonas sp. 38]|nr:hypothetical protein ALTER154_40417 [Alteromonas sp. 154]VXC19509.1 hypothetical protein ALTERO38_60376 [Alteromonas sp. 38]
MYNAELFADQFISQNTSGTFISYHPNGNIAVKSSFVDGE